MRPSSRCVPAPTAAAAAFVALVLALGGAQAWHAGATHTTFVDCTGRILQGGDAGDLAGYALAHAGDVDGDGHPDLFISAPDADPTGANSGAVYLVRGPLTGGIDLDNAHAQVTGNDAGDRAGKSIAAGDVNGDGVPDLIVGAPVANPAGGAPTGAAYVVYGPFTGPVHLANANAVIYGAAIYGAAYEAVGDSVAFAGDVNGDGFGDVLIGVPGRNEVVDRDGAALLFYGPLSGVLQLVDADVTFVGEAAYDYAGQTVAPAGDLDADGYADLLVSAPLHDGAAVNGGAVYVVRGGPALPARLSLADADAKLVGTVGQGLAGWSVAAVGDLDGNGMEDLAIGAPHDSSQGEKSGFVHLIDAPLSGVVALSSAYAHLYGSTEQAQAGNVVGRAGDWDGDGAPDLLVGALSTEFDGVGAGAVHIVRGGPTLAGTHYLGSATLSVYGLGDGDGAGQAALGGVDYDGDGETDVLTSTPWSDHTGTNRGFTAVIDRSTVLVDSDSDMLSDDCEIYRHVTDPLDADTDGDGMFDGNEVLDHDTDPLDNDTDGDLFSDFTEVRAGSDPRDPYSVPVNGSAVTSPVKGPWRELPGTDPMDPLL